MRIPPPPAPPLVGRDHELGILRAQFAEAIAGCGSLVLISGEAGVGKTALVNLLCQESAGAGMLSLVGQCYDRTETPPYGPWIDIFVQSSAITSPSLAPPSPAAAPSREAFFAQTRALFAALTREQPLILLLEDMHWADSASLDLLRFLARGLASMSLLLVATYRGEEVRRRHPLHALLPLILRESPTKRIDLRPLDATAAQALVRARYHLSDDNAMRLADYLIARTEGNALYITELLRSLEEEGVLHSDGGCWHIGPIVYTSVPVLLKQIIDTRIIRLGDQVDALLAIAAVIGQEVPLAVWKAVTRVEEETLLIAAERGEGAHLVTAWADGRGIRFTHALIREVFYESVPAMRRNRLHFQVGEALAALPTADPDAVAYHYRQAGDVRAMEWLVSAGERAHRSYAWLTAADRFEEALAMMEWSNTNAAARGWLLYQLAFLRRYQSPEQGLHYLEEAAHLAKETGDRSLAAHVLLCGGVTRIFAGDLPRGLDYLAAGVDAFEALSEEETQRPPRIGFSDPKLSRGSLVLHLTTPGRFAEAGAMGTRYLAQVTPPGLGAVGSESYGAAHYGMGSVYAVHGQAEQARQSFARSRAVYIGLDHYRNAGWLFFEELRVVLTYETERVAERRQLADDAEHALARGSAVQTNLPPRFVRLPLWVLEGQWGEAIQLVESVDTGPTTLSQKNAIRAFIAIAQGDNDIAWALIRTSLPDGPLTEPGQLVFNPTCDFQRMAAALSISAADLATARAWLEAHDRWLAWSGAVFGRSERAVLWAQYHQAAGDPEAAYRHAEQALADATIPRQPLAILAAHRLLGTFDSEAGRFDDAQIHLHESFALADTCVAPYEQTLTLLAMAELCAAKGESKVAQAFLDKMRATGIPLGAKPALARADALASRLATYTFAAPSYPAGLSAREVEVLRLAASGLGNAAIAERLFLSPHTVKVHMANIFAKIGVNNRAAATRFAVDHGLV